MRKQRLRGAMTFTSLLMLSVLSGCSGTVLTDACAWLQQIRITPGERAALSRQTLDDIILHNMNVAFTCR